MVVFDVTNRCPRLAPRSVFSIPDHAKKLDDVQLLGSVAWLFEYSILPLEVFLFISAKDHNDGK